MPQEKLRAIILKAKPVSDSLCIDTLLESGEFGAFKIPGVLKSNKRSAFHYAPGAVYEIIFHKSGTARVIPKNTELVYSPYTEDQDYRRLAAVAEIIQMTEFIRPAPENAQLFGLMLETLRRLPKPAPELERHLDQYYWNVLEFLGLAAGTSAEDEEYVAYDLNAGYLTAREFSERPAGDFVLPWPWSGAEARKLIRQFLASI